MLFTFILLHSILYCRYSSLLIIISAFSTGGHVEGCIFYCKHASKIKLGYDIGKEYMNVLNYLKIF